MAGQFVRSFTLVRKKLRVSSFKYLKFNIVIIDVCPARNGICPSKNRFDRSQPGNYLQPCTAKTLQIGRVVLATSGL